MWSWSFDPQTDLRHYTLGLDPHCPVRSAKDSLGGRDKEIAMREKSRTDTGGRQIPVYRVPALSLSIPAVERIPARGDQISITETPEEANSCAGDDIRKALEAASIVFRERCREDALAETEIYSARR